jgi:rhomboid protease GluP
MAEPGAAHERSSRAAFLWPFVIGAVAVAAICVVSSFLQVRLGVIAVRDELLVLGVPGAAVALAWVTLWRRPLRRIGGPAKERTERGERLVVVGVSVFWVGCMLLQMGLAGVLAERKSVEDVAALRGGARPTRFVEIARFEIDRAACVHTWDTSDTSSRDSSATVDLDVACPFVSDGRLPWLVWRHREQVDKAKLKDDAERASLSRRIADQTEAELAGLEPRIKYFERIATDATARAMARRLPVGATMLLAKTEPYERSGAGFLIASGILAAALFCVLLLVPIERTVEEPSPEVSTPARARSGRPLALPPGSAWRVLIPGAGLVATPLLLYANVAVFVVMVAKGVDPFSPSVPDLVRWGAIRRDLVLGGEGWRLFTYQFVHGGLLHLVMNGFLLLYAGILLELTSGWGWMFLTYVAGGVAGGLASVGWSVSTSVGASGAILSIVGALVTVSYGRFGLGPGVGNWAIGIGLINILAGLKIGVDGAAHAGGFAAGLLVGGVFYLARRLGPPPRGGEGPALESKPT